MKPKHFTKVNVNSNCVKKYRFFGTCFVWKADFSRMLIVNEGEIKNGLIIFNWDRFIKRENLMINH